MTAKLIPVLAMTLLSLRPRAQETIIKYLSGADKDHTVSWDFFCTTGRSSGRWSKIPVPSNWEMQGFGTYNYFTDKENPDETGLYRYRFSIPAEWRRKSVFIVFEGSMTDTEVRINGQLVGPVHQGGFYRFKYEIDRFIKRAGNLLEVKVSKRSANASVNNAERKADFWQFGGIFRPVYLEAMPHTHIDHIAIDARADGNLRVDVHAFSPDTQNRIRAEVQTLSGQRVGEYMLTRDPPSDQISLRGKYRDIEAWNPESPQLYKLVVSIINAAGIPVHTVVQRFGFRTVELRIHDGLYVNGKKVILKGVCRHSEWPESGRALSKTISLLDIGLMKDMNMNAVRMSHYPPDTHFLDACDSLGMFVLDELTGWQARYDTVVGERLVREMVTRDVNHPSVIIWDNGNEGGWNTALDDQFRLYDPQDRIVIHPWARFNGTDTRHYPNYNYVTNSVLYGQDVFFPTEFMHGNYDGGAGAGLEDFWELILKHPYGAGGFLWVFADGGIVRTDKDSVLDTANDSAPDGVLGPHREKEASFYTIKQLWSPIVIDRKNIPPDFDGLIAIENRYIYTDLDKCRLHWELVSFPGPGEITTEPITKAHADLPSFHLAPGQKGALSLDLPSIWRQCDALFLTATDPHGREIFTWTWPIRLPGTPPTHASPPTHGPPPVSPPASDLSAARITGTSHETHFVVMANGIGYHFDTTTGLLQKVINHRGEISLSGGPIQTGVDHTLKEFKTFYSGDTFIVEPVYEGESYFSVIWTFAPNKLVKLEYQYSYEKHFSQTGGVDFMGIGFKYPEEKITGMKWLGRGPYRVWKNRMKGQSFGVWHKEYNNTITGAGWQYPEFKGYHADLYWVVIENRESPFTVYTEDQSIFLQMLRPDHSKYEHASIQPAFPSCDIGFMTAIAPIGTRFQSPDLLGPQSQKNLQLNYGPVKGTLWFDFSDRAIR
jgi:Glycosyl hydrolases family 2, TIM barrel domain/Glycosyl hydrolases family 2, sugar binding domain/Glycosyl hydrolases family 2/Beta galactosidase small chain